MSLPHCRPIHGRDMKAQEEQRAAVKLPPGRQTLGGSQRLQFVDSLDSLAFKWEAGEKSKQKQEQSPGFVVAGRL